MRRFIAFRSPGKVRTTHTLAAGVQLVKPGEIARAHRHTMGAICFVLRGGGAVLQKPRIYGRVDV
jgi:1-hydroxy-2-naphthoate dioxygenase